MQLVAFLEYLCDVFCWAVVCGWDCLNSHMKIWVKDICSDFFHPFFFKGLNQAFLYHFQAFFDIFCQAFDLKGTFQVIQARQDFLSQVLRTVTLNGLAFFVGATLNILHFSVGTEVFVFKFLCTLICQIQF